MTSRRNAPRRTMSRRTMLTDLGRSTLAVALVGVGVAACGDGDDTAGDDTAGDDTAGDDTAGDATAGGDEASGDGTATEGTSDEGGSAGSGSEVRWERANMGFVSAYVLVRDGEALIVDTGTGEDLSPIAGALEAAGVGWGDVSTVLVTHSHGDHAGGVAGVAAEAPDAVFLGAMPDLDSFRGQVDTAEAVADGDTTFGDLRVVATPGHTAGHVSAYHPGTGLLVVGDALVNGFQDAEGLGGSPEQFTADAAQAGRSVVALADLDVATILFGHGEPLTARASTRLRELADSL